MSRLDPNYIKNISNTNHVNTSYPLVPLGSLLSERPMYGANEMAIDGNPRTDVRYVRISDIDNHGILRKEDWKTAKKVDEKYVLGENDILFARSGATVGKTFIYKSEYGDAIFAGYLIRFRFDETLVNPDFVFYYTLLSRYGLWTQIIQRPSGQPNINSTEFKTFEIPLPPTEIQNHIVEIMKAAYDQKKQKDREADAVLASVNDYVMAILGIKMPTVEEKRCFLVSAGGIEGRIDPSAYRLLKTRTVDAINSSMYESTPLKNAVMFRKEVVTEPLELPYVGLENIESNTGFYVPSTEEKESFNSAFKFYSGDVLFPKLRPYLNKVHLATFNGVCSTEFHVLSGNVLDNLFLFAFLRSKLVVNQTTCLMTGNTHPRLQTNDVHMLPIPLPPIEIQNRIAQEVEHRLAKVEELRQAVDAIVNEAKKEAEQVMLDGLTSQNYV